MKKEIKRTVLERSFGDTGITKVLQERFMELAKTKFSNNSGNKYGNESR